MSIWAKLSGNAAFQPPNAAEEVNPNRNYYYSSNSGQMISSDGSGYVIPNMYDIVAEKHDFIPKELATEKLKSVLKDSTNLRTTYEQNLEKLTQHYTKLLEDSKQHYEKILVDLRQKAVRHVDIQKQMKQQLEDRLTKELKQSEDTLEELRDSLANLNRQYQDDTRKLKGKVQELERLVSQLKIAEENKEISDETRLTLVNLVNTVEQQHTHDFYKETITALRKEMEILITDYTETLDTQRQQHHDEKAQLSTDSIIRNDCKDVLQNVLHTIEIKNFSDHLVSLTSLQAEIEGLQTLVNQYEQEVQEKQQTIDELQALKIALEATIAEKNAEIDTLVNHHENAKSNLLTTTEEEKSNLKGKFNTVLGQMKMKNDAMEVKLCLKDIVGLVMERSVQELTEETQLQQQQLYELASKHHEEVSALAASSASKYSHDDLEQHKKELEQHHHQQRETFLQKLQRLQEGHDRLEVEITMLSMINGVYERSRGVFIPTSQAVVTVGATPEEKTVLQQELTHLRQQLSSAQDQLNQRYQELQHLSTANTVNNTAAGNGDVLPVATTVAVVKEKEEKSEVMLLREQIEQVRKDLSSLESDLSTQLKTIEQSREERDDYKNQIRDWTKAFQETNGREPEVADKALIRDKYQNYKLAALKTKELEGKLSDSEKRREELLAKLQQLEMQLQEMTASSSAVASAGAPASTTPSGDAVVYAPRRQVPTQDAEIQVIPHELRASILRKQASEVSTAAAEESKPSTAVEKKDLANITQQEFDDIQRANTEAMEQLEDQVFGLKEEIEKLKTDNQKIEEERQFLSQQVETLVKEKRTDVLKRYEEDLDNLKKRESELDERVAVLSAEKVKLDTRVAELKERAERAEQELRDRDQREQQKANPQEEMFQLKGQINKQRDQIILKSKAATAGWDAAASADEKLEIEVHKAYQRGLKEEREKHKHDLDSVNISLETKETRITELLVQVSEMERKVMTAEKEKKEMQAQVDSLKLEVADAITGIQQIAAANLRGGGGGPPTATEGEDGEIIVPPSQAELDQAREQLDLAQEELVGLMDRCDRLEAELEIARRKNRIFERLANLTGLTSGKAAPAGGGGVGKGGTAAAGTDLSRYDFSEVIQSVKRAITKGTNLWKSNRKDECYDVYLDVCMEATQRILSDSITKPLKDAIDNGKVLGAANKQRGAVTFRKALDKLLNDYNDATTRKMEEDAVAAIRAKQSANIEETNENNNQMVSELMEQLDSMENSFLEQGYTKEKNPSNSNANGDVQASPRGEHQNGASLLQRAKSAETQVQSLRKQLAAVIAAAAQAPVAEAGAVVGRPTTASARQAVAKTVVSQGADAAEVRRLNRKIRDLEQQLKNNTGGGSAVAGAEIKAMQLAEKQLQKKLKDQETLLKRENKTVEMRAVKAENQLSKIQSTYNTIVSERDQLKQENTKLFQMTSEISTLKSKADRCDELDAELNAKQQELQLLQEQFKKESQLRKKYKNDLEDLKGAIRVYARCRPMAKYEIEKGCKSVVQIKDETSMKVITSRGEKEFEFDAVFAPNSTQDQVFEDTKRLVESCMDGFNVCVFAYGQTGSGKTFTMTGSPSNPGLTPKAIYELFRLVEERVHCNVRVTTYFVELYNDNLVDLFWILDNPKTNTEPPKLEIKMDAKKMVYVRNSVIKDVASPEELMELFNKGNEQRHTGATKMNAESSRSHSIFSIMVESYDTTSKRTTMGKLSLVDLAGSERADKTGASAERLREAQSINKSLSALGDVIAALSEGGSSGGKEKFIPYRNNKLTQLMQDSLGGNAKTLMFVNFSPADYNADETSTSLMYATRVKKIVNNASKQAESEEVARLKAIIRRLQSGQAVSADEIAKEEAVEDAPPVEDDGKVYDGY